MVALSKSRRRRLLTLGALYVIQGVPMGFISIAVQNWLVSQGRSAAEVGGVVGVALLPWVLKLVWGPVIDRFKWPRLGRHRPWILAADAGLLLATAGLAFLAAPNTQLSVLTALLFGQALFSSIQDVAIDGLAVDILPPDERGSATGMMFGGQVLGTAIGGVGLAQLIDGIGFQATVLVELSLLALLVVVPVFMRERPGEVRFPWERVVATEDVEGEDVSTTLERRPQATKQLLRDVLSALLIRSTILAVGIGFTLQLARSAATVVFSVEAVRYLGWTHEAFSGIVGGAVLSAALVGTVVGGVLADRVGHVKLVIWAGTVAALAGLGLGLLRPLWADKPFLVTYLAVYSGFASAAGVGVIAVFMGLSWTRVAATQFAVLMALLNLGTTTGRLVAGPLYANFHAWALVLGVGVLGLIAVVLFRFVDPKEAQRRFREAEGP